MAGLTPAQRRVLEAAKDGGLEAHIVNDVVMSANEILNRGARRSVTITARWLVTAEYLRVDLHPAGWSPTQNSAWHFLWPTAAGRAELGITETEED